MASEYDLVPARSVDEGGLIRFAKAVWPDHASPERILSLWWRYAEPHCAFAAIHAPTATMAALGAARPCEWVVAGRVYPPAAIGDWYVDPAHEGKLLGRRLLRHLTVPDRITLAFSISDVAVAYVSRLGWVGPYASSLLALPLPRLAQIFSPRPSRHGLAMEEHDIGMGGALGSLGRDLDRIEADRIDGAARMRRGADEWSWRLSVCGERRYRFSVAHRAGRPVGYVTVRLMMPGSSRMLGKIAGALITDLVAVNDDAQALRALAGRAVQLAAELRAGVVLMTTTNPAHVGALTACGFLSPAFPLLGRFLARRAPVFMWVPDGPAADFKPDNVVFTFADSDVDLNL